jgi:hypothetical protein
MKERRQKKRFAAAIPGKLDAITSSRTRVLDVETRDISAIGAFIYTKEASYLPADARFILNLAIPNKSNKKIKNIKGLTECVGSMVRSTSDGIAIRFDRECQIVS